MVSAPGLLKLGFLLNESLCSSKEVQENVVCFIYAPCDVTSYTCLPHCVPHLAPNEIVYGKKILKKI